MKTKLFFTCILCLLFLGLTQANEGGEKPKKASTSKSTPSKSVKPKPVIKKTVLSSTVTGAAKVIGDSLAPTTGFQDLFETEYASGSEVRLNPRAISFVQNYMEKETPKLLKIKNRGRSYLNMIDGIFAQHGLPIELKYLAVIESELKPTAVSWAGAVGPWQFMPATARGYGLKISGKRDDRKDYFKSTHAAAKYLKYLFHEFEDWLLVIAAYNGGPGVVYRAIKKSNSRNFWNLQHHLPAESRNHVKKFIATHYIFEGQGGITTLTKAEVSDQIGVTASYLVSRKLTIEELKNAKTTNISGKYHSLVIAKNILMDIAEFNRYNPGFDKLIAGEDNAYELKLPSNKMELFIANKYQILNESVNMLLSESAALKPNEKQTFVAK